MSLTLSAGDLYDLQEATRLLTSPLTFATTDDWRSAVNGHLRRFLAADSAGFLLPDAEGVPFYSDEHDPADLGRYPKVPPPPVPDGTPSWQKLVADGAGIIETIYQGEPEVYLRSTYNNEFAGAYDPLAIAIPFQGAAPPGFASVHLWHSRPDGRRFGDRELAVFRLLLPAFRAGVAAHTRWGRERAGLLDALDRLGRPAAVGDATGRILHATPALEAALADDPQADHVQSALQAVLRDVAEPPRGADGGSPLPRPERRVRTRRAEYALRATPYGGPPTDRTRLTLVDLERRGPVLPPVKALRDRHGLTQRQAEVALLLAQRLTNAEIAERLCVSPHTARHHVGHVLGRLGVARREVRGVVDRVIA